MTSETEKVFSHDEMSRIFQEELDSITTEVDYLVLVQKNPRPTESDANGRYIPPKYDKSDLHHLRDKESMLRRMADKLGISLRTEGSAEMIYGPDIQDGTLK